MLIKLNRKILAYSHIGICLILLGHNQAFSSDYYFRPTRVAMVHSWTPDLEFVVSNPSDKPVLLNLSTAEVGIMNANLKSRVSALKVFPKRVLLQPGESRAITIEHDTQSMQSSYEIVVDQVPIWFGKPGGVKMPKTMTVTRYTAEVIARSGGEARKQFAVSGFSTSSQLDLYREFANIEDVRKR
ncbi:hypothetical protein [Kordiimonas aquimaris]|uniref:hypothetical protein n=1 Tax=Kordiimonas aquimaris TaxID=707591 RepID=UPI0021D0706C|nr:hypothetical protein [Kordiimonas aquimaris]